MVLVCLGGRYLRNKKAMTANYFVPSDYHLEYLASLEPAVICLQGHSPGMHISIGEAKNKHEQESIAGEKDPIFPIAGIRKAFRQTKKIYKAFKVENRLHLLVGKEGHRFYQNLAWPVIKKHL